MERYPESSMALFKEWATLSAFLEKEIQAKDPSFLTDAVYPLGKLHPP